MSKTQSGLGKGLDALLPSASDEVESSYMICPLAAITPNPAQPRKVVEDESLLQLADSIRAQGVLLPLVVREISEEMFEIIAGERRWRAARLAGLTEIPVLVKDVSPQNRLEMALIENIQRQDINPMEEAEAYLRLVQEFGLTQEEVAKRVGKERSTVANILRIVKLPDFAKKDIVDGILTMGHARVLLSLHNHKTIKMVRDAIVKDALTVRQAETLAKKLTNKQNSQTQSARKKRGTLASSYCRSLSNDLVRYLGCKSKVVQSGSRGKIEIEYYSADDLERLLSLIIK